MPKVIFYLKSEKPDKYGKVSVLAQATHNYKSYRLKIGKAKPQHWNKKQQRLKLKSLSEKDYSNNIDINSIIDHIESQAKILNSNALMQRRKLTESEVRALMTIPDLLQDQKSHKFMDVFDDFIENSRTDKADRTTRGYTTVKNLLLRFERDNKFELNWENLDANFIDKLAYYVYITNKYQKSYYAKITRVLSTFLHWAEERNYYKGDIYDLLKVEEPEQEVIFITIDELLLLNDYSFESERLSRVRDLFCFASFTGLRFSDLKELNREHHRENAIVKNHKKTQKIISTSLNEFAKEILSKYSDEPYLLPRISHDKANEYIKECFRVIAKTQPEKEGFNRLVTKKSVIGNVVEEEVKPLHEAITFHIARKTFITNSIMLGVNIKVLQDMGAPLREKDLRKYLKINDAFKSKVMDETWNKIR